MKMLLLNKADQGIMNGASWARDVRVGQFLFDKLEDEMMGVLGAYGK